MSDALWLARLALTCLDGEWQDHVRGRRHARRLQYIGNMPESERTPFMQRVASGTPLLLIRAMLCVSARVSDLRMVFCWHERLKEWKAAVALSFAIVEAHLERSGLYRRTFHLPYVAYMAFIGSPLGCFKYVHCRLGW